MRPLNLLFLITLLPVCVMADQVGVLGGLRGNVTLDPFGRDISVTGGYQIQIGDRIRADEGQLFQLILRDETTLTFGGGADISLDVFEFNEATGLGELQITQYAGLMKFATGRIANGQVGVFRINQPQLEIAVLGTMGVVGVLTQEQASTYFPQVTLPEANGVVSYAALMGPGQRASHLTKSGAFQVSVNGEIANITRPGGSVLANENSGPITFVAPPLAISNTMIASEEEEDSSTSGSHRGSHAYSSNASSLSSEIAGSIPSPNSTSRTSDAIDSNTDSILRDVRSLIDQQTMLEALGGLEQAITIPVENNAESLSPVVLDELEPLAPLEELEPLAPLDEFEPLRPIREREPLAPIGDLEPLDPIGELDPIAPLDDFESLPPIEMMCPGDPACP